jgi:hemoglobin
LSRLLDKIGPEPLRAVIADFYDRVFADVMIGYMFASSDKQRLIDKEWELTARFLGGEAPYTGKTMRDAHAALQIFGGQFDRRLQILKNTLRDHRVDPAVAQAWIDHQLALRDHVVGGDCA